RFALLAVLSATAALFFLYKSRQRRRQLHSRLRGAVNRPLRPPERGKILFLSQTGTSKGLARRLHALLTAENLAFDLVDPKDYEPEDLCKEKLVLIVASTWEDGGPPRNGSFLMNWLTDSADDFRVGSLLLIDCNYAIFGVGSKSYGATYNAVASSMSLNLQKLGATELIKLWEADVDEDDVNEAFEQWSKNLVAVLKGSSMKNDLQLSLQGYAFEENESEGEEFSDDDDDDEGVNKLDVVDLEDIAGKAPTRRSVSEAAKANGKVNGEKREMLTPLVRANLEKQGYKIIGSHSGVKLCRWTKSQLRGRGGCYKHSFYGIESHRCMEATPSLACANKCVFCWRHHTNPVGKSWQWKMDEPLVIVNTAIDLHVKMINEMKGVPG
ncbi:hypothetical protein M569_04433, partial [Genlisea aurea]